MDNNINLSVTPTVEEIEKKRLNAILEAKNYYKEQEHLVKKAGYLLNVLEENYISTIRGCPTRYDFIPAYITDAFKELSQTDKRKAKHNLEYLEHCISEDFFDDKIQIKITNIIQYGMVTSGLEFYFEYNDKKYWIYIPLRRNLSTLKSDLLEGQFGIFFIESDYSSSILFSSYDINEMKDYILHHIYKEEPQIISTGGCFTKEELINGEEKEIKDGNYR